MSEDPRLAADSALQIAQEIFIERGRTATSPLTKFDIYYEKELFRDAGDLVEDDIDPDEITFTRRKTVDGKSVVDEYWNEELRKQKEAAAKVEEEQLE